MNTSYKNMLRDRCPEVVDLALRWCKVKTQWVDHVYNHFIRILLYEVVKDDNGHVKLVRNSKELRKSAVRYLLGLSKTNRVFVFDDTIDWDNLDKDEAEYWKNISVWVKWFQKNHASIVNLMKLGYTNEDIYNKNAQLNAYKAHRLCEYIRENYNKTIK